MTFPFAPPHPILCGILNVTPDSFSDGGRHLEPAVAVAHGRRLIEEGARIIDVGGESTRPGATGVSPAVQIERVLPVIRGLEAARGRDDPPWTISIDTTSAPVAEAAIAAGATFINDVSAGLDDPAILECARRHGTGIVLMHRRVAPAADRYSTDYDERAQPVEFDIVREVAAFLRERVDAARAAGIAPEAIAIDPGFGFGKSVAGNYALLDRLTELRDVHPTLFVGLSRKSFLDVRRLREGVARDEPAAIPADRVFASVAAALLAAERGAAIVRVHDVAATREALDVLHLLRTHGGASD